MTLSSFLVILMIGLVGSVISGMLGIGGSIVKYPLLLYIPPLLGVASFTVHQVSGISAVQVLFAASAGVFAYRKSNLLHWRLIAYMGTAIWIGSFVGAYGAKFLSEATINIVYASLASIAALMMFFVKRDMGDMPIQEVTFHKPIAIIASLLVGLLSGIVGAAGAFILVPIMLVILRIPTRVTIASSLAITLISSIGTTLGKMTSGDILLAPALIMIWASIVGAPIGVRLGKHIDVNWLRLVLAGLIIATSVKIWTDIFR